MGCWRQLCAQLNSEQVIHKAIYPQCRKPPYSQASNDFTHYAKSLALA